MISENIKLSIVVPCYNEAKNIPLILSRFNEVISGRNDIELILVDNNSSDNSAEILQQQLPNYPFARTVFQKTPGYGAAVNKGLKTAKGEYLCWTHADMQTDPGDTIKALSIIQSKNNPQKHFIKGNRKKRPFVDNFFQGGMSVFETVALQKVLYDINAQPNLFHRSFLDNVPNPPDDFSFDLYFYYIAKKNSYKVERFPVLFPERMHGESTWNTSLKGKGKFIKRTINFTTKLKKKIREENKINVHRTDQIEEGRIQVGKVEAESSFNFEGIGHDRVDFNEIVKIVIKAGEFAKKYHGEVRRETDKSTMVSGEETYREEKAAFSFVDTECQKIIMQGLLKICPEKFGIIAEEQNDEINQLAAKFAHQNQLPDNKYTILIDPIDGTSNFCAATPTDPNHEKKRAYHNYWGVSLAIAYGREIVAGVIYYPKLKWKEQRENEEEEDNEGIVLKTIKGKGTRINDTRIVFDSPAPPIFSPDKPIRIGGALNNPQLKNLFPNIDTYGAFVVTFLALLKGGMKNPLEELTSILASVKPICSYIGRGANPLDIGCCALAYIEAGGFICNEKNEPINLFDYASFGEGNVSGKEKNFKIDTFFVMSKDKSYSDSVINYLNQNLGQINSIE